jgi:hypothetical protein
MDVTELAMLDQPAPVVAADLGQEMIRRLLETSYANREGIQHIAPLMERSNLLH